EPFFRRPTAGISRVQGQEKIWAVYGSARRHMAAETPILAVRSRGFASILSRRHRATATGNGWRGIVQTSGAYCSEFESRFNADGCSRHCTVKGVEIEGQGG
ncbi:hypothetical protein TorRG33x02_253290, partial [Trema orientale]